MKLLPYDSFQIETPLSLEEAHKKFNSQVFQHQLGFVRRSTNYPFHGKIQDNEFRIERSMRRQNSFLPLVTGKLSESKLGTLIEVEMGLRPSVLIFMLVWLGFFSVAIFNGLFLHMGLSPWIYTALVLLSCAAILLGPFWYEAIKQKKMLLDLFEGKEVQPKDSKV